MDLTLFHEGGLWALGQVLMIDIVLAGDNAVVIGLAAARVPKNLRKKVILWGLVAAVALRIAMAVVAVKLLAITENRTGMIADVTNAIKDIKTNIRASNAAVASTTTRRSPASIARSAASVASLQGTPTTGIASSSRKRSQIKRRRTPGTSLPIRSQRGRCCSRPWSVLDEPIQTRSRPGRGDLGGGSG